MCEVDTKQLDRIEKKVGTIEVTLVGDMERNGKVGLLERVRKIEEWIEKREWAEKVIIAATITNSIALIAGLIIVIIQITIR
jgi:hypothetical protein